ncbi:MAG: hypothetical protein M3O30_11905 [Planctomycetota bacterium]|nr:hypothetical protein [Planctomycetota bacterium]
METKSSVHSSGKTGGSSLDAANSPAADERATPRSGPGGAVNSKVVTLDQMRAALFPALRFDR